MPRWSPGRLARHLLARREWLSYAVVVLALALALLNPPEPAGSLLAVGLYLGMLVAFRLHHITWRQAATDPMFPVFLLLAALQLITVARSYVAADIANALRDLGLGLVPATLVWMVWAYRQKQRLRK